VNAPLYTPRYEHDACGVGFVARVSGLQDHDVLVKALQAVANVTHRGAVDADAKTGDGSGVLTQLPRRLLVREAEKRGFRVDRPGDLALAWSSCRATTSSRATSAPPWWTTRCAPRA
jgi:glutamate synthase domain-containing protein 1